MGLIFRLLGLATLLFTLAFLALVGTAGYLFFAGGASRPDCAPPAAATLERAVAAVAFDAKLAAFVAVAGRLAEMGFSEEEATARAERFFEGRTGRISGIALCFEDGKATGFLRVETALGRKIGVRAEGTLDLSGEHPVLHLSHTSAAGIPVPGLLRREVEDIVNRELQEVRLAFPMRLTFADGEAELSRGP
ncbi:MAG TPA: hypothetical protein VNN10_06690 [Dehalococcoidia bacterium]|nr:hypothetical protein [Dehalococcoidia bacterium]